MVAGPATPDYWEVLGLAPGADGLSLKRAFRAQARRWHPDLNGNDSVAEERFKLVNEAYAVLSDPRRRQLWEAGTDHDSTAAQADDDPFTSGFPDFEHYLATLFNERPRQAVSDVTTAPPPPPPVRAVEALETLVELTPDQALHGERIELELQDGTCVEVWTPPLAGDGWRLRLAAVAPGGGDHFLQLRVRTPEGLRIDGLRVTFSLELSPAEAALGCLVLVPTLDGDVQLRVPPGSSSGRLLRLRGRGMGWGDQRGDMLVEIVIVVPGALTDAETALYRRLQELAAEADAQAGR